MCLLLSRKAEPDPQKTTRKLISRININSEKDFPLTFYIFCKIINNLGWGKYQTLNEEYFLNNVVQFASTLSGIRPVLRRPDTPPRRAPAGRWNTFSPRPSHSIKYKSWISGVVPVCHSGSFQFVHTLKSLTARLLKAA